MKLDKSGSWKILLVLAILAMALGAGFALSDEKDDLLAELANLTTELEAIDGGKWVNYSDDIQYITVNNFTCNATADSTCSGRPELPTI